MTRHDPRDALAEAGLASVPRETIERLETFVALLLKWQPAQNLIAASTVPDLWRRHVADSAQLMPLAPRAKTWVDLGSGAGFPGMVIAILIADDGGHVDLVESDGRKCAFLRAAVRATGAAAAIHEGRIEKLVADWPRPVEVVTARALAPLDRLLGWTYPLIEQGAVGMFPKGIDFRREVETASQTWNLDLVEHPSRIDSGVILEVTRLAPKARRGTATGDR